MTTMKTWKENTDMKMQANPPTALNEPERLGNQALGRLSKRIRTAREKLDVLTDAVAPLCRLPQQPSPEAEAVSCSGSIMAEQVETLICLVENMELRIDDVIERLEFGAYN